MVISTVKQIIIVICSVLLIAYAILQFALNVGDIVSIEYAAYAKVQDTVSVDAYIFRDESVINQSFRGTNCYLAENGEKVHIGQQLCITYSNIADANVQDEINTLTQKIDVLEQSSLSFSSFSLDINKIDENISSGILDIQRSVRSGELERASRSGESLLIQMNRRQAAVQSVDSFGAKISEYRSRKALLEAGLTGTRTTTAASSAGYFYTEVDGYESAFSASAIEKMTLDEFNSITGSPLSSAGTQTVIGKIAPSSKWFLLFKYTKREASAFKIGSAIDIIFPYTANRVISMTLEKVIAQTDTDEVVMVLSTNMLPEGFNFTRRQEVEVVRATFEGLKIRTGAIRRLEGKAGIYSLRKGNVVIFKTVDILYEDKGFYVVALPDKNNRAYVSSTAVSLYDAVITEGKDLFDGKVLK